MWRPSKALSTCFERVALAAIASLTTIYLADGVRGPETALPAPAVTEKVKAPTVAIGVPPEPITAVSAAPVVDKPAEGDWLTKRMMRIDPVTGAIRE